MSKNYLNCPNGHFYSRDFSSCPHCQSLSAAGNDTVASGPPSGGGGDGDSTLIMGGPVLRDESSTRKDGVGTTPMPGFGASGAKDDRTIVVGSSAKTVNPSHPQPVAQRKLMAWLVSYTWSDSGVDFRLFEGQNNIGRDAKNTVRITEDTSVSSEHAVVLCRAGKFYLQDKLSTNPSFVNGEELAPGATRELRDGDELTIGKTALLIRFAYNPQ
jgi:hypothetical protein